MGWARSLIGVVFCLLTSWRTFGKLGKGTEGPSTFPEEHMKLAEKKILYYPLWRYFHPVADGNTTCWSIFRLVCSMCQEADSHQVSSFQEHWSSEVHSQLFPNGIWETCCLSLSVLLSPCPGSWKVHFYTFSPTQPGFLQTFFRKSLEGGFLHSKTHLSCLVLYIFKESTWNRSRTQQVTEPTGTLPSQVGFNPC